MQSTQFGEVFRRNNNRSAELSMIEPALLRDYVNPTAFLGKALKATTSSDIEGLLAQLPIAGEHDYSYDAEAPESGWQPGKFHWVPVGQKRGNAGQIKQANQPVNPIAERTVNGMEAMIEMARQREVLIDPSVPA